jgi:hypothetical protein
LCCEYNMTWQDCITSVNLLAQGIDITWIKIKYQAVLSIM